MSDNAEQGEQPGDPVKNAGVGAGAAPDDAFTGAVQEQIAAGGSIEDPRKDAAPQGTAPGAPMDDDASFADSEALQVAQTEVDTWGAGPELPQGAPGGGSGTS